MNYKKIIRSKENAKQNPRKKWNGQTKNLRNWKSAQPHWNRRTKYIDKHIALPVFIQLGQRTWKNSLNELRGWFLKPIKMCVWESDTFRHTTHTQPNTRTAHTHTHTHTHTTHLFIQIWLYSNAILRILAKKNSAKKEKLLKLREFCCGLIRACMFLIFYYCLVLLWRLLLLPLPMIFNLKMRIF